MRLESSRKASRKKAERHSQPRSPGLNAPGTVPALNFSLDRYFSAGWKSCGGAAFYVFRIDIMDRIPITAAGAQKLKQELDHLRTRSAIYSSRIYFK